MMPLGTQIAADLPYLRRYARALVGEQALGDALVRETLEAALADEDLRGRLTSGGRVALYRAFSAIYAAAGAQEVSGQAGGVADARLGRVAPRERQALLLTAVEEFTPAQAGRILDCGAGEVLAMAEAASEAIARDSRTSVLVIEDEPLIAMQIENLVLDMGHSLFGTATTRAQAGALLVEDTPGLVLADIQLADGSSGLDAVEDLLAVADVPVIFITAYPERLLTGGQREPTWLIAKPFREEAVRAAVAQALFFQVAEAVV
jgi:CheY-like chemotaxis protein/DNA-directed RNA polymerase specialized sigma24 family protein